MRLLSRLAVAVAGLLLLLAAPAGAVPAKPDAVKTLEQPDGSAIRGHLYGDEWENGYQTKGGYTVVKDRDSGYWEYARKDARGRLVASGRRPGRDAPSGAPGLRDDTREPLPDPAAAATQPGPAGSPNPINLGTQRSLVILVRFTDQPSLGTTAANWNARFFGATDSVASYYKQVSFNKLTIAPAAETSGTANDGVVGWLSLNRTHPNVNQLTNDTIYRAQETVRDAVVAANPFVNFASYDTNGNGQIDSNELHITVIPAGWEASSNCAQPSVWGHKYGAYDYTPTVDGVLAGVSYTMFGEKHCDEGTTNPRMAQLGIMAHEMGHDLGWPDLYDVDYSTYPDGAKAYGNVGYWSVMASGSWLYRPGTGEWPGASPPHPDAWSKAYQGWITPTEQTGTATASIAQAATNPVARQLRANPNGIDWSMNFSTGTGEYFLVENRQPVSTTYDRALPGCGLAIWHIDEASDMYTPNKIEGHRMIALAEADGDRDFPFEAGDVWAGAGKSFNSSSTPSSNLYGGAASGVSAGSFSSCGATMTASLTAGGATPPLAGNAFASPTAVTSGAFTKSLDTTNATTETGEPTTCTVTGTQTSVKYGKTVWFKYTPATSGTATAETTGSGFDTVLAAWQGGSLGTLANKACNDDDGTARQSKLSLAVTGGQTYYFQVAGYQGTAPDAAAGALTFKLAGPASGTGGGTVPANDAFGTPAVAAALPFSRTGVSTAAATTQTGEKTACTPAGTTTAVNYGKTVWLKYVPNVDMAFDATTAGSTFNTVMAIYRGTTLGGLTLVGCNNNATTSVVTSRLQVPLVAGQTYYVQVGGFKTGTTGTPASGTLNVALSGVPRGDAFGTAQSFVAPYTRTGIDTARLTTQTGESLNPCSPLGKTMWFTFTPGASGRRIVSTVGSTYDTVVAVYSGTSLGALTKVGCNDDIDNAAGNIQSSVGFDAVAGRRYYLQVGGYRDAEAATTASGKLAIKVAAG
ncbi:MAG TPA: M6 family metalloprotease domain-containing protein [Solirubrobacteraceae bacterium]|jgi:M6 family metalloprotease-like protein